MKVASFPEPVTVAEDVVLAMDFVNDARLAAGETISSPVVTAAVRSGEDANVAALLGTPVVVGTKVIVRKKRDLGVSGVNYLLVFQVDTSNNQRLTLGALLACKDYA